MSNISSILFMNIYIYREDSNYSKLDQVFSHLFTVSMLCTIIHRVAAMMESQLRPGRFIEFKVKAEAESRPACWLSSNQQVFTFAALLSVQCTALVTDSIFVLAIFRDVCCPLSDVRCPAGGHGHH